MPQWQGGNNPHAYLGAKLLAWLAPQSASPLIEVPVPTPNGKDAIAVDGINHRAALIKQLDATDAIIRANSPDKIVVFGGDCLVSQAPFAYLNEKYDGQLGVLWLDSHPDIKTPKDYPNAHTMVLGNLLGEGDAEFAGRVKVPLKSQNVMFGGLRSDGLTEQETSVIKRLDLRVVGPYGLKDNSDLAIDWIKQNGIRHLAIHLDLDVLDPVKFRSTFFGEPEPAVSPYDFFPEGKMSMPSISRIIADVSQHAELVGLNITEHLPWDAINLKSMLGNFAILR